MDDVGAAGDFLFEVSYEVANKVGGIYAVIRTKSEQMMKYYGNNYYVIGFYIPEQAKVEFEEEDPKGLKKTFLKLEKMGIKCHFGKWVTAGGRPNCILLDINGYKHRLNDIKTELWMKYKIDSLRSDSWFGDPVVWSYAVGLLLEMLEKDLGLKNAVAQFHEWMAGVGLLYLKSKDSKIATVFTTHATMLGRTMASYTDSLVDEIDEGLKSGRTVDPKKAYEYSVEAKHLTGAACARTCDVFTTVSETTAREAEYILSKKPDVVLPNGLDLGTYPSMEECVYLHRKYKGKIMEFLSAYFKPYYEVNLNDPRIMYISGRYEIRNKGIDIFVRSLSKLNNELKGKNSNTNVFAFILIPANTKSENHEVLENLSLFSGMREYVDDLSVDIRANMLDSLTSGKTDIRISDYLTEYQKIEVKKLATSFKSRSGRSPPLSAFDLYDQGGLILKMLAENGLLNREEDRVKVIFYPAYLSNSDRMLSLSYNSFTIGCSLGVFPSSYEPWGYTPLETIANGALTVTTDLAGYGKFMEKHVKGQKDSGIYILKRSEKKDNEVVDDLKNVLLEVVRLDKSEIISRKHNAKKLSLVADWKNLAGNYIVAHNMALKKVR
ncbi:MAG: glycogen/starch synthase [archaeon]